MGKPGGREGGGWAGNISSRAEDVSCYSQPMKRVSQVGVHVKLYEVCVGTCQYHRIVDFFGAVNRVE